jgi:hypothetical protein
LASVAADSGRRLNESAAAASCGTVSVMGDCRRSPDRGENMPMNASHLHTAAALLLALAAAGAWAQPAPAASVNGKALVVAPAPSAPVKGRPAPRRMTAAESRETATLPGELKPEGSPTQPQLNLSLGKRPSDPVRASGKTRSSVNDSAVRCAAMVNENDRALCRERAGLGSAAK